MPISPHKLELLWRRLEDAKLRMDFAHNYLNEIRQDRAAGALPSPDGQHAHLRALNEQQVAVKNYFSALEDFRAALSLEKSPTGISGERPAAETAATPHPDAITPREREVVALIAAGKSSKQIAAQLGISFRTVVCHRYRLYQKLKVHTNVELTHAAMRMGLIQI